MPLILLLSFFVFLALPLLPLVLYLRLWHFPNQRTRHAPSAETKIVAFFHPWSNDGGGGERVLWRAVLAVQALDPAARCVVYTGDADMGVQGADILTHARETFGFNVSNVDFVFLKGRSWVEAQYYPHFTMLCQCLGSLILGWEALNALCPHVVIDTMGYAFTYPIFRYLGGCKVACYVHYPVISTDMLARVSRREAAYNNASSVAGSTVGTNAKLIYYRTVSLLYGIVGRCADIVMVNSSWTRGHIDSIWRIPDRTVVVFPPCDTRTLSALEIDTEKRVKGGLIISVSQFRPEKNQMLQLEAFSQLVKGRSADPVPRLVLIGHVRKDHPGDESVLNSLKDRAEELGISDRVTFDVNVSYARLVEYMGAASIGLHTMELEHFGIGVVDMMAAGLIVVAHNSGGPKADIVGDGDVDGSESDGEQEHEQEHEQRKGYLATTGDEYARCIQSALNLSLCDSLNMRQRARAAVIEKFSEEAFDIAIKACLEEIREYL